MKSSTSRSASRARSWPGSCSTRGASSPSRRSSRRSGPIRCPRARTRCSRFTSCSSGRRAELRLAAVEQRIDAELELGRHDRLVAELEGLVEDEPLRERLRRQLMLSLYRSGRQADALARYREGRRLLVDELGIEPSPQLQELERAILRHDPALEQTGAPPP